MGLPLFLDGFRQPLEVQFSVNSPLALPPPLWPFPHRMRRAFQNEYTPKASIITKTKAEEPSRQSEPPSS